MKNYIEVSYDKTEKPFGIYPIQLAEHIANKYSFKKGMRLLDNGCGRGEFLHAFAKIGLDVHGTDLSSYCKEAIKVNLEKDKLPFPDDYFDIVFSKSVIEHITNVDNYITEMRRVLKPDGRIILLVPDWETQYKIFYYDPTHVHPYTAKSVERLLSMFDFKDIQAEKFIQLPSTWKNKAIRVSSIVIRKVFGPVRKVHKNKFFRFSRELMILGTANK